MLDLFDQCLLRCQVALLCRFLRSQILFLLVKEVIASRIEPFPKRIDTFPIRRATRSLPLFLQSDQLIAGSLPIRTIFQCLSLFTQSTLCFKVFLSLSLERFKEVAFPLKEIITHLAETIENLLVMFLWRIANRSPFLLNRNHLLAFFIPVLNRLQSGVIYGLHLLADRSLCL